MVHNTTSQPRHNAPFQLHHITKGLYINAIMADYDVSRSPGSTIAASEMGEHMTNASSPTRPDPRSSLHHVLDHAESQSHTLHLSRYVRHEGIEDEGGGTSVAPIGPRHLTPVSTAPKGKGRSSGSHSKVPNTSIHSGNKVRHLKKDDGEPLWRTDIQYDFLKLVFEDKTKCFTNSYEPTMIEKQDFASVYIDAMARSSKTSKILRDKLLSEHEPAKNMAMVCLLVNLGRMNTTLNCK